MTRPFVEELKTFYTNARHLKFKSLLIIIIILAVLPLFFYSKLNMHMTRDFNNSFRYMIIYLINMYHLILLYNNKIYELDNGILVEDDLIDGYRPRPIDILRRFIDQAGLNLDGLVDIEIIQIEPDNYINQNQAYLNANGDQALPQNNDTQNVHDTSIQSHINIAISALKKCKFTLGLSDTELVQDIRNHILNKSTCSDEIKDKALVSLKKIKKINGIITRINISELEVLHLVWNRIHDAINYGLLQTLKDNLVIELADSMIDEENVHCVQGRVTRILQTLESADAEGILNLKPLWVIKEEIASVFGRSVRILNKKLKGIPHIKKIYNKIHPTDDDLKIITKINDKLKQKIDIYLKKTYVDKEIINLQQYTSLTNEFYSAI